MFTEFCKAQLFEPIKNSSVNIFFLTQCNELAIWILSAIILAMICFFAYKLACRLGGKNPLYAVIFILFSTVSVLDLFAIGRISQYVILLFTLILFYSYKTQWKWHSHLCIALTGVSILVHEYGWFLILLVSIVTVKDLKIRAVLSAMFLLLVFMTGYATLFVFDPHEIVKNLDIIFVTHGYFFGMVLFGLSLLRGELSTYKLFVICMFAPIWFTPAGINDRFIYQFLILAAPVIPLLLSGGKRDLLILLGIMVNFLFFVLPITLHYFFGTLEFFNWVVFNALGLALVGIYYGLQYLQKGHKTV